MTRKDKDACYVYALIRQTTLETKKLGADPVSENRIGPSCINSTRQNGYDRLNEL